MAVAEAQQVDALQLVLDCAWGERYGLDCMRQEDRDAAIILIAYNPLGLPLVNARLLQQDNFDALNATMADRQLARLLGSVLSLNTVGEDVQALRDFFGMQTLSPMAARAVEEGLQAAEDSRQLVDKFYPVIREYLESRAWQ